MLMTRPLICYGGFNISIISSFSCFILFLLGTSFIMFCHFSMVYIHWRWDKCTTSTFCLKFPAHHEKGLDPVVQCIGLVYVAMGKVWIQWSVLDQCTRHVVKYCVGPVYWNTGPKPMIQPKKMLLHMSDRDCSIINWRYIAQQQCAVT